MQFTLVSVISLLSAAAFAAPTNPPLVRIQLTNDQSGRNANKELYADGQRYSISAVWAGSAVDSNGAILASSAQLTAFPKNIQCAIYKERLITVLTNKQTYGDLDGNPAAATPINLAGATIECNGSN